MVDTITSLHSVFAIGMHEDGTVWVRASWDGTRLSFVGVIGPRGNGDCRGGCGQIVESLHDEIAFRNGWTREMANRLIELWDRWHLNDTRAGSPAQEARLRTLKFPGGDHYTWAKEQLKRAGLQPDMSMSNEGSTHTGYSYGSSWLHEDVPADVLAEIASFPTASKPCPWRNL